MSTGRAGVLPVPHTDFFSAAPVSSREVVLNDAKVRLQVETIQSERVTARVTLGGSLAPHKGITFTASDYRQEHLSAKDQSIVDLTRPMPMIQYAISYLRDAAETQKYRDLLGAPAYLIAKLERRPAIADALLIAAAANELWLCRGDLGPSWASETWPKPSTNFPEESETSAGRSFWRDRCWST